MRPIDVHPALTAPFFDNGVIEYWTAHRIEKLELAYSNTGDIEALLRGFAEFAREHFETWGTEDSLASYWKIFAVECQRYGVSAITVGAPFPDPSVNSTDVPLDRVEHAILRALIKLKRPLKQAQIEANTIYSLRTIQSRTPRLERLGLIQRKSERTGFTITEAGRRMAQVSRR